MSYEPAKATDIERRLRNLEGLQEIGLYGTAAMALCEVGLLQNLVELMALAVPRERMPDAERLMLDMVLERT